MARITAIRREVSRALGFVVPGVRIRDDLGLEANQYRIRIGQTIVGEDRAYPDRKLALPGDRTAIQIDGIEAFAGQIARVFAGVVAVSWMVMTLVNAALAQGLLKRFSMCGLTCEPSPSRNLPPLIDCRS